MIKTIIISITPMRCPFNSQHFSWTAAALPRCIGASLGNSLLNAFPAIFRAWLAWWSAGRGWTWGIPPDMAILDVENDANPCFCDGSCGCVSQWSLFIFIQQRFGPAMGLVSIFLTKGPASTLEVDCRCWSSIVFHILVYLPIFHWLPIRIYMMGT